MAYHSDNGPCYSSAQFKQFALSYEFVHLTNNSYFVQVNGKADCALCTAKEILCKSSNLYVGLLTSRSKPRAVVIQSRAINESTATLLCLLLILR